MSKLVIIGSVGNCLDILDAVRAGNGIDGRPSYEPVGFLDDAPGAAGTLVCGLPVLGALATAAGIAEVSFVCGIGSPTSYLHKHEIIARIGVERDRFATIVHPAAVVSPTAQLGRGAVVLANATVCAMVDVGDHVMMLPSCVVGHDSRIGDCSIMAGGVIVSGKVTVGRGCYLGAGSVLRDGVTVGDASLVGMGSVIVRDVESYQVVAGNPARRLEGQRK